MAGERIINTVAKEVHDVMYNTVRDPYSTWNLFHEHKTDSGSVLIEIKGLSARVDVVHDNDEDKRSPLLESAIKQALPEWMMVYSEALDDKDKERREYDFSWLEN